MSIIELSVTNMCAKFQANIFIFCCAMAKNPSNGNDVTFLNSIFEFLIVLLQNKWPFWNRETKLDKIGMFLK